MTASTVSVRDLPLTTIDGTPTSLSALGDGPTLVVNVASQCGLTPQYAGLERIAEQYAARGLTVVGVPCNQFGGQEPGTAEEIAEFCSTTYGVTFPLLEKIDVNGDDRHPLYAALTATRRADGTPATSAGTSRSSSSTATATWSRGSGRETEPEAPEVLAAIDAVLA